MPREIELKPCPFCGGEAKMRIETAFGRSSVTIECENCGARCGYVNESVAYCATDKAAENWNRRLIDAEYS